MKLISSLNSLKIFKTKLPVLFSSIDVRFQPKQNINRLGLTILKVFLKYFVMKPTGCKRNFEAIQVVKITILTMVDLQRHLHFVN